MYIDKNTLLKYIDEQELIRLTDDENLFSVNDERIDEAIKNACDEFNNYIGQVYDITALPVPLPAMLTQLIVDLTIYNLYKRRYRLEIPESLTAQHEATIDILRRIARGELTIIDIPRKNYAGFIKINKTDNDRIFGKETLDQL